MFLRNRNSVVLAATVLIGGVFSASAHADDAPSNSAPAGIDGDDVAEVRALYEQQVRSRLPRKMTSVIDGAFALYDLRELRRVLPELWRTLRDDPELRVLFAELVNQYRPRLDYAGYVGTLAQTTNKYGGLAVGFEADLAAPICRYIGGAFDGQLFADDDGRGLAYNTRITGCLPWGPFALELGFTSQRSARMGLAAAPVVDSNRYDAQGFEMRIRGFRYRSSAWEVVTLPTEVVFVDRSPASDDGRENAHFSIDSAAARYVRYGAGPAGEDRGIEAIPVRVTGEQDADGAMRSATVVEFGLLRLTGARLAPGWFLDANATFQQGSLGSTVPGAARDATVVAGGVDTTLHVLHGAYRGYGRYRRGLVPDSEFRLLIDDRGEVGVTRTAGPATLGAVLFAAYTRTVETPVGTPGLAAGTTGGASAEFGYAIHGPLYFTARGEIARSYYASAGDEMLAKPAREIRFTIGLAASASSSGTQ